MIVQRHRKAAELAQKLGRKSFGFGRNGGRAFDHQQWNVQLLGQRDQYIARRDEAEVNQDLAQFIATLALQFERPIQVFTGDQVLAGSGFRQAAWALVLHGLNRSFESGAAFALRFHQFFLGALHHDLRWAIR